MTPSELVVREKRVAHRHEPATDTSRSMEVERLGEHMMYEHKASNYNAEQIEETKVRS